MAYLKRSRVELKTEKKSRACAVIAVAKVTNDPNYKVYIMERKRILLEVRSLLQETGFDLSREGGILELTDI
jgi:hypothetical protein